METEMPRTPVLEAFYTAEQCLDMMLRYSWEDIKEAKEADEVEELQRMFEGSQETKSELEAVPWQDIETPHLCWFYTADEDGMPTDIVAKAILIDIGYM